ncbi:hypothetical protein [Fulvivirga lutimaris]|uniref:hypothetical protein n=1 Tax=Fulvivirga lutimaris TaxID=1819566 RepID=UPI0012BD39C4|nr:hypothetical protein [Fulvivirga lutimaris]MTI41114.1 hypothetical protein [Fulvivirga lutimaris]
MKTNKEDASKTENEIPEWLKAIQINSWEAELLISALLLYMLFQVPEVIENYRDQHYELGGLIYRVFGIFINALKVLRIGYCIHIIARGIWVASVGLSYIYPKSLNIDNLKFKGKFRKELEDDIALDKTIKGLEKVASMSYSISFMLSGMILSAGMLLLYLLGFVEWVLVPATRSGNAWFLVFASIILFVYCIMVLIMFVDFITNGFFRREPWASRPYYYVAVAFRYLTFSFIYNRISLTIISNLPKWQAHMVPILAVMLIGGYMFINGKIKDFAEEKYLESAFTTVNRMNYESLRKDDDPIFATIQSDVIDGNFIKLFTNTHGQMGLLYSKDSTNTGGWSKLNERQQSKYADRFVRVAIDNERIENLDWLDYKHPISYAVGFINYIDVSKLKSGMHTLTVDLDTVNFNDLQKKTILERDPLLIRYAKINFYKAD